MQIFALHGYGLDGRLFDQLQLPHYELHCIDHLDPLEDEPWQDYILRHAELITTQRDLQQSAVLLGHSFGGVMVQELVRHIQPSGIILVSTICAASELPPTLSLLRRLPIYELLLREVVKRSYFLWGEADGYNTSEERGVFHSMVDRHSDYYFRWAVRHIVHWEGNLPCDCPVLRLHGDQDKVFPLRYIKDENIEVIPRGNHIMIKSLAPQLSSRITTFIEGLKG